MRLCTILLALITLARAADQIQIVGGGTQLHAAPDGTLFQAGFGRIDPTPGAYKTAPDYPGGGAYVRRFDPATGRVHYATYLDFQPTAVVADANGALYLYGLSLAPDAAITPGAYDRQIKGGEQLMVVKLNPEGTALEFATILGGSGRASIQGEWGGLTLAPDGTIYVVGITCSKDFPTTADAFQSAPRHGEYVCDAFFASLSADASRLLYATYLGGSQDSRAVSVSVSGDGKVRMVGATDAVDFPTTPGSFTLPSDRGHVVAAFTATWDPDSRQFTSIAAFGTFLNPLLVAWNGNRAAIAAFDAEDAFPAQYQHLWPVIPGTEETAILVFDTSDWHLLYAVGVDTLYVHGLALDADGSLTLEGAGTGAVPPSPGAHALTGREFVFRIDPAGSRSVAATYFDLPVDDLVYSAAITSGTVYVTLASFSNPVVTRYDPFPIIVKPPTPGTCATMYAVPKVVQQCGVQVPPQTLYWDACDPQLAGAEVHVGTPGGPLLQASTSGGLAIAPANTTYFLVDTRGRTLATEEVVYQSAPRCSAVPHPVGQLTALANPVLTCSETPLTGMQASLSGNAGFLYPLEIRVLAPDGPELAYSPGSFINAVASDWVRDGMAFFLTGADQSPLAMERVFLMPIRSCSTNQPAPAAIQAKPATIGACGTSTLAWYSAGVHPVEIRESTASGRTVARFDQTSGLLDVAATASTTYHMVGYVGGDWIDLASVSTSGCPNP
jgi:hypothetical protein